MSSIRKDPGKPFRDAQDITIRDLEGRSDAVPSPAGGCGPHGVPGSNTDAGWRVHGPSLSHVSRCAQKAFQCCPKSCRGHSFRLSVRIALAAHPSSRGSGPRPPSRRLPVRVADHHLGRLPSDSGGDPVRGGADAAELGGQHARPSRRCAARPSSRARARPPATSRSARRGFAGALVDDPPSSLYHDRGVPHPVLDKGVGADGQRVPSGT